MGKMGGSLTKLDEGGIHLCISTMGGGVALLARFREQLLFVCFDFFDIFLIFCING